MVVYVTKIILIINYKAGSDEKKCYVISLNVKYCGAHLLYIN